MRPDDTSKTEGRLAVWLPALAIGFTVVLFAVVLSSVSLWLRAELQRQIVGRDAHGLAQMALMWGLEESAEAPVDLESGLPVGLGHPELEAMVQADRLKEMVSRRRDLLAARLFRADGTLVWALPPGLKEDPIKDEDLATLRRFQPVSHYRRHSHGEELFPDQPKVEETERGTRPILEVTIPLRGPGQGDLVGLAQWVLDGQSLTAEFAALDRHLFGQAAGVFLVGCTLLVLGLTWAFRRLQRANRLLHERTFDLLRANEELAMAARTSAVGAVTAHLIHGLKNPLSGLQQFVHGQGAHAASGGDALWAEAARSTQRIQHLLSEVTRVLHDEQGTTAYELSGEEFLEILKARVAPAAETAGVELQFDGRAPGTLTNREANLLLLVIENLLANAIEASGPRGPVALDVRSVPEGIEFCVRDHGPGVPDELRDRLFKPVPSAKPGGTGIGLAISQRLALHLGARLELRSSSPQGAVFSLTLPRLKNSFDSAGVPESHDAASA